MSVQLKLVQNYYKTISFISPKYAAKKGINLFCTVRLKGIKNKEAAFYEMAKEFHVPRTDKTDLTCYELGNPAGKVVFLIHGWDSNIGCMTLISQSLLANHRIIGIGLPAHGYHADKQTNLVESSEAFKTVLEYINPTSFDVVSHSFGSAVVAMGLAIAPDFKADKLVFLTAPNKVKDIFDEFKNIVKIGDKAYQKMLLATENDILNEKIEDFTVVKKLKLAHFEKGIIIHDKFDKALPFGNAEEITKSIPKMELHKMEKIGHYRMLWNEEVVELVKNYLKV